MVDLVTLQTISYTAGSLSVVLGVIYYAINKRIQKKRTHNTGKQPNAENGDPRVP